MLGNRSENTVSFVKKFFHKDTRLEIEKRSLTMSWMFVLSLMFDEISLSDENEFFKEAFKLSSPRCTSLQQQSFEVQIRLNQFYFDFLHDSESYFILCWYTLFPSKISNINLVYLKKP